MSMKRSLFGIAVAAFFGGTLIAACDGFEDGACITDSDCISGEEVCLASTGQCTEICEGDGDCWGNDECRPRPGSSSDIKVCLPPQTTGNGGEVVGCTDHSDCDEAAGEFCDTATNKCVGSGGEFEGYYTVLIEDATPGERCDDTTYGYETAGVKLTGLILRDGGDNIVGYGKAITGIELLDESAFFGDPKEVLNGTPGDFDGQCPAKFEEVDYIDGTDRKVNTNFLEENVVALGCGGKVFVQFIDSNNNAIPFDDSNSIEIRTYGTVCSDKISSHTPQSQDDPYDVSICTDNNQTNPDISTCETLSSGVQGITTIPVSN